MTINFRSDPYYDDFDEGKNFHRVLFKPGVAVQARELNQLQTILQEQVARFGKHVFKPGSLVIPGNTFVDRNFNYVKLEGTYNLNEVIVNNFIGREITGQTTGLKGTVVLAEAATDTDQPTLFVKYLNSGTSGTTSSFAAGEILETSDTGQIFNATVYSTAPTGKCIGISINTGVYFIKNAFVRVESSTIILDKYASNSTYKVGLNVLESVVDSDTDSSLLDPALGTYNYFAPGADRYKIELVLAKRGINEVINDDSFIELLRVQDGELVDIVNTPGYNILQDELARRTYDESGNYTVKPFNINFIEHLKTINSPDGYKNASEGGDSSVAIAVLSPGKAYVRGYEVETISNSFIPFNKPRDTANVINAVVRTPIGNYTEIDSVYGMPNFTSDLITVNLYDRYTATPGSSNGTLVGTARVRGTQPVSSNVMLASAVHQLFLFDVRMSAGYTFEKDVKQIYHASVSDTGYVSTAFTCNVVPTGVTTSGTVSLTNGSSTVTGVNSVFTSEIRVGDYVRFTSDTSNSYRVTTVTSNNALVIDRNYPLSNVSGVNLTVDNASIISGDLSSLLFPFPNSVIKSLADSTYRVRKTQYKTLSAGSTTLTTPVGTTFASRTDSDYFAVGVTGGAAGKMYRIGPSQFSFTDAPVNRNISINLSAYGLTTEDVLIYTTVIKADPVVKTKTVTSTSTTLTSKTDCQASTVQLGYADVYEVSNVRMSANVFGTAYLESNSQDISDRYTLVTGQTPTYYGISSIKLKPGAPAPTGPIKVTFKYYAHGSGDYFSVESYPDYESIPEFTSQGTTYQLRDYLDFRPRIDNTGSNFKNTGSSRNDFLDFASDFQTDYDYYLPRIDKIYLSKDGVITYKEGISSLTPAEPLAPDESMPLYVIEHPAYGFDIKRDSKFTAVDQKRYTMKDIGKLETRIKNLEYYTSLSLLELDTAVFSIKDSFGLERYKNGFIVDSFKGHGIGDVRNPDYKISMDIENGILKPPFVQKNIKLSELNTSDAARTSNGYSLVNETIMLDYVDEPYITLNTSSGDISITPFDNYTFAGQLKLTPSVDTWFDEVEKPIIYTDDAGTFDTLIPDAVGVKAYGTIWNVWKQVWTPIEGNDQSRKLQTGVVVTESSITGTSRTVVFPYVRAASITFEANKLKPNTRYYAYFNDYNVTNYCTTGNITANVFGFDNNTINEAHIVTDQTGKVKGVFNFNPTTTGLKIPAGIVTFRLTDSSTNGTDKESFADAYFTSNGTLTKIEKLKAVPPPQVIQVIVPAPPAPPSPSPAPPPAPVPEVVTEDPGSTVSTGETSPGLVTSTVNFLTGSNDINSYAAETEKYVDKFVNDSGTINEVVLTTKAPTVVDYEVVDLITTNSYNFVSGATVGGVTSTGTDLSGYLTATNILDAVNTNTGKSFVEEFLTNVEQKAGKEAVDNVVMPMYNGTKYVTTEIVNSSRGNYESLPKDMRDFWEAGLRNGSWTDTPEGEAKAIAAYAAAVTVGYMANASTAAYNAGRNTALYGL